MPFSRPSILPLPTVWHRFSVIRGGAPVRLRVQDLTAELKEPALHLLATYFTRDEPPCKYIEINKYPSAVAELKALWRKTVEDNLSLVCVEDRDDDPALIGVNVLTVVCKEDKEEPFELLCYQNVPQISVSKESLFPKVILPALIGVNVLTVVCKEDKEEPFETDDKIWAQLFGAVDLVGKAVDVFQQYEVDKYLTAYGLVIDPAWRGCSIGKEILRARIPLCKALGIKLTTTVFTAAASQAVAKKAGFVTLYEISYEELARRGFVFPGVEQDTTSSKLMALVVE